MSQHDPLQTMLVALGHKPARHRSSLLDARRSFFLKHFVRRVVPVNIRARQIVAQQAYAMEIIRAKYKVSRTKRSLATTTDMDWRFFNVVVSPTYTIADACANNVLDSNSGV